MKTIGVLKVSDHSYVFGGCFNEFDVAKMKEKSPSAVTLLCQDEEPRIPLAGARITQVWDADPEKAKGFASILGGKVVDSPTAMMGEVDAILLAETSGDGCDHASLALPYIQAGIPIFVDKPFSNNLPDARKMVEAAEKAGGPLMSSSLLRYVKAVEELKAASEELGEIRHVVACGPGDTLVYGVHTCEYMLAVSGPGVEWVQNLGHQDMDLAFLKFSDNKTAIMQIFRNAPADFNITVYGSKAIRSASSPFLSYRYGAASMMQELARMIDTGRPPIPYASTLEILKILLATGTSLAEGKAIRLSQL